jgi:hypothetical protein
MDKLEAALRRRSSATENLGATSRDRSPGMEVSGVSLGGRPARTPKLASGNYRQSPHTPWRARGASRIATCLPAGAEAAYRVRPHRNPEAVLR